jgi:hypothetical protein
MPKPNYLLNSSPGKWQVIWKVEGFTKEAAENLQKALAWETGADPAAIDCARVLRLPGFVNHKYTTPHVVSLETLGDGVYRPEDFPEPQVPERNYMNGRSHRAWTQDGPSPSQSERDWAFAKRALARGESPEVVVAAIAEYRRDDKHNPQYYAELTVRKAAEALKTDADRSAGPGRI